MNDVNEAFDAIFMAEEKFTAEGFQKGYAEGQNNLDYYKQGFNTGLTKADEISKELSKFWAFSVVWINYIITKDCKENLIKLKALMDFKRLLEELDKDIINSDIHVKLINLRVKYNQICILLNIPIASKSQSLNEEKLSF